MITKRIRQRNFWIMLSGDAVLVFMSYLFAYMIRFEFSIPENHLLIFLHTFYWVIAVKLAGFYLFNLYKGMWRYTSLRDLINIIKACIFTSLVVALTIFANHRVEGFSRSVPIIDLLLTFLFISSFRIFIRINYSHSGANILRSFFTIEKGHRKKICIIGAGNAGEKLLREFLDNPKLKYDVVGFIDDDPKKLMDTIHRVPVVGNIRDLPRITKSYKIDEIAAAIPSATAFQMRRLVESCKRTNLPFKILPGLAELVSGEVTVNALREVRYQDLLGRAPVKIGIKKFGDYITGKRILVTGAAGSIGSELCRQIAKLSPAELILVDRNESGLYDINIELITDTPSLITRPILGAVQNMAIMTNVFMAHTPHTVFHAAAYKHVPMMESFPWEAVYSNVQGTWTVMTQCKAANVERCVIVSTDKAVRPTNVMGATKRMVEKIAQCYGKESDCRFMAVRFGNVLGSAGSVLPVFKRQIAAGGPVTVTHPEVTRYFMTIPEACSLILQAGAIGVGNEIFVLKMGTPTKIDSMARDLITLSGFTPDVDIKIKYTGLRPGEKLYEELITDEEDIQDTPHEDIMVLRGNGCIPTDVMTRHVTELVKYAKTLDADSIRRKLKEIVPEYHIQGEEDSKGNVIQLEPWTVNCEL